MRTLTLIGVKKIIAERGLGFENNSNPNPQRQTGKMNSRANPNPNPKSDQLREEKKEDQGGRGKAREVAYLVGLHSSDHLRKSLYVGALRPC